MVFERIESEGLAHYSYLIGDRFEAVVIDPRRDCGVYIERARRAGMRISLILETHRNEDYVVGSVELADRTGAEIRHADSQWPYAYGEAVADGEVWKVGGLAIESIHAPGHTPGMMAYLVREPNGDPWILFSGDSLFAGDVGRVDLLGEDRLSELAGLMYDTLHGRFLPLGDGVIVCPAHGAGSVCAGAIAERPWTTIGLERERNPKFEFASRDEFIEHVGVMQERPPYFRRMEEWNLAGAPLLGRVPTPPALPPDAFAEKLPGSVVLDTRSELAFGAAHVPGSQSIWLGGLAGHAGWYLPLDRPLLLVGEGDDLGTEVRRLLRMGYDDVAGSLSGGMLSWHTAGRESASVSMYTVQDVCRYLDRGHAIRILDVRSDGELEREGRIPNAVNIHVTQVPERAGGIPGDGTLHVFCGSGLRSMVAASYLAASGRNDVAVILGGLSGWNSTSCPLEL
jgi:hydroxyacylglutathione hydrolase